MKKNLISINEVIVEFDNIFCFIKAKKSKETCLIRKLERGLYRLEAAPNKASFYEENKEAARVVFLREATNTHP